MITSPLRRDMTLIAGFKCADGYVLCADSQETVKEKGTEYRVIRRKLAPVQYGDFELSLAGAGDGRLIDNFVKKLRRDVRQLAVSDPDALSDWFQDEMKAYFREQGVRPSRSGVRLTVGAWHRAARKCALWDIEAARVGDVDDYSLIGHADHKYEYAVQQLYQSTISIAQGIFLGLYVMSLAERTSNYVKGPISVIVIRDSGIHPQPPELVKELDQRVQLFATQFDKLLLTCPDTGLQHGEFASRINEFVKTVVHLRREYVEEWVGKAVEEGLNKVNDPYTLVPAGQQVVVVNATPAQVATQTKMYEDGARQLRQTVPHLQDVDRLISNLNTVRNTYSDELEGKASSTESNRAFAEALN